MPIFLVQRFIIEQFSKASVLNGAKNPCHIHLYNVGDLVCDKLKGHFIMVAICYYP